MPIFRYQDNLTQDIVEINSDTRPTNDQIQQALRDQRQRRQSVVTTPQEEPQVETTATGRIGEFLKAIPRGFSNTILTDVEGVGGLADVATNFVGAEDLIDSGDENALISAADRGKDAINRNLGANEGYADLWTTKLGEGIGSFATFFTPGLLAKLARFTNVARFTQVGAGTLATTGGAGEQVERLRLAEESGIDITQGDRDTAIFLGSIVGLSELAPINRLLRRLPDNLDPSILNNYSQIIRSAATQGTAEAIQEASASIAQDAIERNIYNENLPAEDSLLGTLASKGEEASIGFVIGALADASLGVVTRSRINNARNQANRENEERLNAEAERTYELAREQRETDLQSPSIDIEIIDPDISERVNSNAKSRIGSRTSAGRLADDIELRPIVNNFGTQYLEGFLNSAFDQVDQNIRARDDWSAEKKQRYLEANELQRQQRLENYRNVNASESAPSVSTADPLSVPLPQEAPNEPIVSRMTQYADDIYTRTNYAIRDNYFVPSEENGEYIVRDNEGNAFSQPLKNSAEAQIVANRLNENVINESVSRGILSILDSSENVYTEEQTKSLHNIMYKIMSPSANTISASELNQATDTTVDKGYAEFKSYKEMADQKAKLTDYTTSQLINRNRVKRGLPETDSFSIKEINDVLGNKWDKLSRSNLDKESYSVKTLNGKPVVESSLGEIIRSRPLTQKELLDINSTKKTTDPFVIRMRKKKMKEEVNENTRVPIRNLTEADFAANYYNNNPKKSTPDDVVENLTVKKFNDLLKKKNISNNINSAEMQEIAEMKTGNRKVSEMSNTQRQYFYAFLRSSLPQFTDSIKLPSPKLPLFNGVQFKRVQDAVNKIDGRIDNQTIADEAGIPSSDPRFKQKVDAIKKELKRQQRPKARQTEDSVRKRIEQQESVGLPAVIQDDFLQETARKQLQYNKLMSGLRDAMKGLGIGDVALNIENKIKETSEGYYDPAFNKIILNLDSITAQKAQTDEQKLNALIGVLNHESVHAMREMDLFTASEWTTLSNYARNKLSNSYIGNKQETYLEKAQRQYSDLDAESINEEAIAELVRDFVSNTAKVSGKPRSLLNRIVNFLEKMMNFVSGSGFNSFNDIIQRVRTGEIGSRERGVIRTSLRESRKIAKNAQKVARTKDSPEVELVPNDPPEGAKIVPNEDGDINDFPEYILESRVQFAELPTQQEILDGEPLIPKGVIESEMANIFKKNAEPTTQQLKNLEKTLRKKGLVKPNTIIFGSQDPTSYADLKEYLRQGMQYLQERNWYKDFGDGFANLVGINNLNEASAIFGITSARRDVESNFAETIAVMIAARKYDPVTKEKEFLREIQKPIIINGKRNQSFLNNKDKQKAILKFYKTGRYEQKGFKTTTFSQNVIFRGRNMYMPFTTHDTHMGKAFKVDVLRPNNYGYRYAQYMTAKLAREFNMHPDQVQASIWVYARNFLDADGNLKTTGKLPETEGNFASAMQANEDIVEKLNDAVDSGIFVKDQAFNSNVANPMISGGVKYNKKGIRVEEEFPYTSYASDPDLRQQLENIAPQIVVSAKPGNARGYLPQNLTIQDHIDMQNRMLDSIRDEEGQISLLKELGIDHTIETGLGSYENQMEPSMRISLIGESPETTDIVAVIMADALMQDAVITHVNNPEGRQHGFTLTKIDGNPWTQEELNRITEEGIDFSQLNENSIILFDDRVFDPAYAPEKIVGKDANGNKLSMRDDYINTFKNNIIDIRNKLGYNDAIVSQELFRADTNFYADVINKERGNYARQAKDIYGKTKSRIPFSKWQTANDLLYKPIWQEYKNTLEEKGIELPDTSAPPSLDQFLTLVEGEQRPVNTPIKDSAIQKSVEKAKEYTEKNPLGVPSVNADARPEAVYLAENPDQPVKEPTEKLKKLSLVNTPSTPKDRKVLVSPKNENQTMGQKILGFFSGNQQKNEQNLVGWNARTQRFYLNYVNQYAPLQYLYDKNPEIKEITKASLSLQAVLQADKALGLTQVALTDGVATYENGVHKVKEVTYKNIRGETRVIKGAYEIFSNLLPDGNSYGLNLLNLAHEYLIAKRAKRLNAEGITTPIPKGEEDAYLGKIENEIDQYTDDAGNNLIRDALDDWSVYNSYQIKYLKDTGVLSSEEAIKWEEYSDYVPFYRAFEDELTPDLEGSGLINTKGKTSVAKMDELTGSGAPIDENLLLNITKNTAMIFSLGTKNVAQGRVIRDLQMLGLAEQITKKQDESGKNLVRFRVKGQQVTFEVKDPILFQMMLPMQEFNNGFTKVLRMPAVVFRDLITRDPGYAVRNFIRDAMTVQITGGAKGFKSVSNAVQNFNMDSVDAMGKLGVISGIDNQNLFESPEQLYKSTKNNNVNIAMRQLKRVWDGLDRFTRRSDAATRKGIYDYIIDQGGTESEAVLASIQVMNFGQRGRSPYFRVLTSSIPFLNSRIIGIYNLGRAFQGKYKLDPRLSNNEAMVQMLWRAGGLAFSTMVYYYLVSGEDWYEEQSDPIKDNYWMINVGLDAPLRIPIPFELGILFKTLPERIMSYRDGSSSMEELQESGARAIRATMQVDAPQIIQPILEALSNKDTFTRRPIVGYYQSKLEPELQYNADTSIIARELGEALGKSPIMIDHFIEGYTGTLGVYLTSLFDSALRSAQATATGDNKNLLPSTPLYELPVIRSFFGARKGLGRDALNDFYRMYDAVDRVYNSLNALEESGDFDAYDRYLNENIDRISFRNYMNNASQSIRDLRNQRDLIIQDPTLTREQKREYVDQIDRDIMETVNFVTQDLKGSIETTLER